MSFNDSDNWKIDPFTGTLGFQSKTETHTVRQFTNFGNRYGIQVDFGIMFNTPSTVSIPGYTEVAFATSPSIGQFRVDYDPLRADGTVIESVKYKNTGFIEFNASNNGASVTVTYRGTGAIVKGSNLANFIEGQTIPGSLNIDEDLVLGDGSTGSGNLFMSGVLSGDETGSLEIDPNAGTILNLQDGVNPSDAATVGQVQDSSSISIGSTGTHAPAGTQVKMAWFESTTNGAGTCIFPHGLGTNILNFNAMVNEGGNSWTYIDNSSSTVNLIRFNETNLTITLAASDYYSRPVRFMVWYKE